MDINEVKEAGAKVAGFWSAAAAWVAAHPKTTIAAAVAAIVAVLFIAA